MCGCQRRPLVAGSPVGGAWLKKGGERIMQEEMAVGNATDRAPSTRKLPSPITQGRQISGVLAGKMCQDKMLVWISPDTRRNTTSFLCLKCKM